MTITQCDALFDTILHSLEGTPTILATFIHGQYSGPAKAFARAIIRKRHPAMPSPGLVAEAAAETVIDCEVRKALAGALGYSGRSRYSTYLYQALVWQVPRVYGSMVRMPDPGRLHEVSIETDAHDSGGDPILAQAYRSALYAGLNACIARMEPDQAELVTLVYVRGLTPTAACRRLGLRSPSHAWKLAQARLRALAGKADLAGLYAAYREQLE